MLPEPTLVHRYLEQSARAYPDKTAIVHGQTRIAYAELEHAANRLARRLVDLGVGKGAFVPLLFENGVEYVIAYFGIMKAGAIAVPLGTDLKPENLAFYIRELAADTLLASGRFDKLLRDADLAGLGICRLVIDKPSANLLARVPTALDFGATTHGSDPATAPEIDLHPDDLANIIYTSGSTGTPKGVMLTHRNIRANTRSICQYLHLTADDIQMVVLPFFYVMGQSLMNTHIAVGGTLVINNQFAYPAAVVKQMVDEKVTGFSGVPSTFAYLLHRSPLRASRDVLRHLRYVSQAGGHMANHLKLSLRQVLPEHTAIYIMYGATEASARLAYLEPEDLERKTDAIGKAIPGVELYVADAQGRPLPDGEVGELIGRGENIMRGYFKDPELTAKKLGPEGYHTGDLCYRDSEGYFFLVGRQDDLVKVGGHRVNPREIEDAILASDLVVEVAVVALPDPLLGNILVALAVKRDDSVDEHALADFCQRNLARFKQPAAFRFARGLPKKMSGKIDRFACAAQIKAQLAVPG